MSNDNVTLRVVKKTTQAAPEGVAQEEAKLTRKEEDIQSNKTKVRLVAGGAIASLVALVALSMYTPAAAVVDKRENITAAVSAQLEVNKDALVKNGVSQGVVRFRDWAALDGDAVIVNGVYVGPLTSGYTGINIGPGALSITAAAGEVGCVTVEIADPAGPVYQVCVQDGAPINTFVK